MSITKSEKMAMAYNMGIAAFEKGMKCVPAHDKSLTGLYNGKGIPLAEFIQNDKKGFNENLIMIKAWTQGWTIANLNAPVKYNAE